MAAGAPLILLGVRRSGTTLLRVMLDRNAELAVPDESYFVPQLARRHRGVVDVDAFVDDVRRLPTLVEWELSPDDVAQRLRPGMSTGAAIAAVFETYANGRGKARWGDKTPLYMQYLPLLERLFPDARFVHLVRDGRDAALSFLAVPAGDHDGGMGLSPRRRRDSRASGRARCATRARSASASASATSSFATRQLVVDPADRAASACARSRSSAYDEAMLGYVGQTDSARKRHQQRLNEPPRVGRAGLADGDVGRPTAQAFEEVAGELLAELGYEVARRGHDRRRLAAYRAKTAAWRGVGAVMQRSPLWRRRHRVLQPGV